MTHVNEDFHQWIKKIEDGHPRSVDLGLERIQKVAKKADLLEVNCPVVMVAGTNGKGSTVAALARLLREAGLKVGTYTSPHLLQFNERIHVNGSAVSNNVLIDAFEKIDAVCTQCSLTLTFFEFTTLAALAIFKDPQYALDIVILEVGLGGRLDAVNLIAPDLSIITSIGFDHQELLGNTLEAIAQEKAGILRPHIPVILSEKAYLETIITQTKLLNNTVYLEGRDFDYHSPTLEGWQCGEMNVSLNNLRLPPASVSMALAAYTILRNQHFLLPHLSEVVFCLEYMSMVGRAQWLNVAGKKIILDVAHNSDASVWLAKKLNPICSKGKILAVWASLADKALADITAPMKKLVDVWNIGAQNVPRAASCKDLQTVLIAQRVNKILVFPSIVEAFEGALDDATADDIIVVFGSFYTVSAVLQKHAFEKPLLENNGLFYSEIR